MQHRLGVMSHCQTDCAFCCCCVVVVLAGSQLAQGAGSLEHKLLTVRAPNLSKAGFGPQVVQSQTPNLSKAGFRPQVVQSADAPSNRR